MEKLSSLDQLDDYNNLEKYKTGGVLIKKILNTLIKQIKNNSNIKELCMTGDNLILEEIQNVFKKTKFKYGRGISFPTCISLNNISGYYRPINNELIKNGDVVKVEMGLHLDGYPSVICKTIICNDNDEKIDDKKLNLLNAVKKASAEVTKMLKDGLINKKIIKKLEEISDKYNCKLLTCNGKYLHGPGVISYQMSQNNLDGKTEDEEDTHQLIIPRINDTFDFEMGEIELCENEVYCFDIGMSTGSGKLDLVDSFCNIYKRNIDNFYSLKLKSSKEALGKFNKNYFPICVSNYINPRFKFGLNECLKYKLIDSYPAMKENSDNEFIARNKFTIVIRKPSKKKKKGSIIITDLN